MNHIANNSLIRIKSLIIILGENNQVPQCAWNLLQLEVIIDGFHTFKSTLQYIFAISARFDNTLKGHPGQIK
jgi:hypothetical protein